MRFIPIAESDADFYVNETTDAAGPAGADKLGLGSDLGLGLGLRSAPESCGRALPMTLSLSPSDKMRLSRIDAERSRSMGSAAVLKVAAEAEKVSLVASQSNHK